MVMSFLGIEKKVFMPQAFAGENIFGNVFTFSSLKNVDKGGGLFVGH